MPKLDAAFSALSDPTRRAILARLAISEATVMELAEPFEMTQRRVEGTKRPCRLAKAGIEGIDKWLAMLREALAKSYDRLDKILADENGKEMP
jgi:DNA-binding transcriptional ArsR family regulator